MAAAEGVIRTTVLVLFLIALFAILLMTYREQKDFSLPQTSGWGRFWVQFASSFSLYAISSHIVVPTPMTLALYNPLKIFIFYFGSYLSFFLFNYFLVSLVVLPIVFIRHVRGKKTLPLPITLGILFLPTLFILGIGIYGRWYGYTLSGATP